MGEVFIDSLVDTAKMIPFLLVVYAVIEILEHYYGDRLKKIVSRAGKAGPLIGAIVGSIPQCGFSVVFAALYTKNLITTGTLLAVFLSTSDEAVPVILSQPDRASIILPIIGIKVIIAIIVGYLIDTIFRKANKKSLNSMECQDQNCQVRYHHHNEEIDSLGCCGHHPIDRKIDFKEIIFHPIIHTLKISFFIFAISLIIGLILSIFDDRILSEIFFNQPFLQPIVASLIGLIPNCASSVAITQLYLDGIINFPSVIAGLLAGAGLGLIVLFREKGFINKAFMVLSILFLVSVISGIILDVINFNL